MSMQLNSEVTYNIRCLPLELQRVIFYFIPLSFIRSNETKLIKNVIDVYSIDHDPDLTKQARMYYVKNIVQVKYYFFQLVKKKLRRLLKN
jgi:hypothetical protein